VSRLKGRKILVTGAASGLGREVVKTFAREGAVLALLDRDAAGLESLDTTSACFVVDLQDTGLLVETVSNAAGALGGLDGIVNAAGYHMMAEIENTTDELWAKTIAVNLTAPMVIVRTALPWLRQNPASTVVNVASGAALYPVPTRSAYVASKGGLVALSKAMALELAPAIRVNCICPGAMDTPMLSGLPKELYASIASTYSLKRIGNPSEIADGVLYLTSQESSYVTGIALAVDGGRSFH
jgi:NAD(P)-dependent dehydrogenase (short-subunit alcohol dehydrogenase family)